MIWVRRERTIPARLAAEAVSGGDSATAAAETERGARAPPPGAPGGEATQEGTGGSGA